MDKKEIKKQYKEVLREYNGRKDLFQFYLRALEVAKHGARMERPNGLFYEFYDERIYKTYCDDCRTAHEMLSSLQKEVTALKYKLKYYRMLLNKRD